MSLPFPEPTAPQPSRTDVLLGYVDYFRSVVVAKVSGLPEREQHGSRLPSGWSPFELVHHLTYVERRWLVWGFEGQPVADPWGDQRDGRWHLPEGATVTTLVTALEAQAEQTRAVARRHDLSERGRPGERWDGAEPATLERVLLHLVQEYARHTGHLDIVRELADGAVGE